jgi:hypothetical protein
MEELLNALHEIHSAAKMQQRLSEDVNPSNTSWCVRHPEVIRVFPKRGIRHVAQTSGLARSPLVAITIPKWHHALEAYPSPLPVETGYGISRNSRGYSLGWSLGAGHYARNELIDASVLM